MIRTKVRCFRSNHAVFNVQGHILKKLTIQIQNYLKSLLSNQAINSTTQTENRDKTPHSKNEVDREMVFFVLSLLMFFAGIVWSGICLLGGLYSASILAFGYTLVAGFCVLYLFLSKRFYFVSQIQLLMNLIIPFIFQWILGGFEKSGAMMLWAMITPFVSQFISGFILRRFWVISFFLLLLISGAINTEVSTFTEFPVKIRGYVFVINVILVTSFIVFASRYFYVRMRANESKLSLSLDAVTTLKNHQDGDYFLTSLLVSPLTANRVKSLNTTVDIFIQQKKKFQYNNHKGEIGGDFCLADSIFLRQKKYIVLMSADAMGKSIQGASGALIIGTILQLLLDRTTKIINNQDLLPERWLRKAFAELDSVFDTLSGRMQVSFILALYDERFGVLYKMNVEHPQGIHQSGDTFRIMKDQVVLHKLGSGLPQKPLTLDVVQLSEGDSIYFGSDGKDDILLEKSEDNPIYNEDPIFFMNMLSQANGNLNETYSIIQSKGEIIDDFSILKLSIREIPFKSDAGFQLLQEKFSHWGCELNSRDNIEKRILSTVKTHMKNKRYPIAFGLAELAASTFPMNIQFFMLAAHCARKNDEFNKAIDFGEALVLRGVEKSENYLNLARSYFALGLHERSRYFLSKITGPLQQHPIVLKLWSKFPN